MPSEPAWNWSYYYSNHVSMFFFDTGCGLTIMLMVDLEGARVIADYDDWTYKWFGWWREDRDGEGWRLFPQRGKWGKRYKPLPSIQDWLDPSWDCPHKDQIINYLRHAPVVFSGPIMYPTTVCVLGGIDCLQQHGDNDDRVCQSDGVFLWKGELAHYVEHHGLRLPNALIEHMQDNGFVPPADLRAISSKGAEAFLAWLKELYRGMPPVRSERPPTRLLLAELCQGLKLFRLYWALAGILQPPTSPRQATKNARRWYLAHRPSHDLANAQYFNFEDQQDIYVVSIGVDLREHFDIAVDKTDGSICSYSEYCDALNVREIAEIWKVTEEEACIRMSELGWTPIMEGNDRGASPIYREVDVIKELQQQVAQTNSDTASLQHP